MAKKQSEIDKAVERDSAITNALVRADVAYIKLEISEIKRKLDDTYVTKIEFQPVRALVYGLAGLVLSAVVIALVALVVQR